MSQELLAGKPAQIGYRLTAAEGAPAFSLVSVSCTVLDSAGAQVVGSPFACTFTPSGVTSSALLTFGWSPPTGLADTYRREYNVAYAGGVLDTFHAPLPVVLEPSVADLATYDPTTPIGQIRLLVADTSVEAAIWSDAEITAALNIVGGTNLFLAGALLLEAAANDAAKIALIVSTDNTRTDTSKIPGELRASAASLRARTIGPLAVLNAPDPIFTNTSGGGTQLGTTALW